MAIVAESVTGNAVCAEYQVYSFFFGFLDYIECKIQFIVFTDRRAYLSTKSLGKGIGHTTAQDEVVNLVHKVFDNPYLGRDFTTAHNRSKGTLNVAQDVIYGLDLLFHKIAQHLVIGVKVVCYNCCGCMATVCGAECIVYIYVSIGCKGLSKCFLTFFHLFLCCVVCGIIFFDAYGFAFFFGMEAKVLKQQYLAGLECCCSFACIGGIISKFNVTAQILSHYIYDLLERQFGVYFAFRLTHMRHNDERTAIGKNLFQGGKSSANTSVVGDVAVFVQRHIEVHTDNGALAGKVKIVYCHNLLNLYV